MSEESLQKHSVNFKNGHGTLQLSGCSSGDGCSAEDMGHVKGKHKQP